MPKQCSKSLLDPQLFDPLQLKKVTDNFSFKITSQIEKILEENPNALGIAKQFLPDSNELIITPAERVDPIGDVQYSPLPGIVHRHADRCLLKAISVCPVYCRFCFRKDQLGGNGLRNSAEKVSEGENSAGKMLTQHELEKALEYIASHKEIWEVILTGGDPLILKPKWLSTILERLTSAEFAHINVIRIHTRVPVVDSKRINVEMIQALKQGWNSENQTAVYVVLHANHPDEFTKEALEACAKILDAGIPMLSQTVLLKGINDNITTLSDLMKILVRNRIKPYYLHHPDLVPGTSHFRCSIKQGQALVRELRRRISGLCQPTYVLDIPGGFGKIPLGEAYICGLESDGDHSFRVQDLEGATHIYSDER